MIAAKQMCAFNEVDMSAAVLVTSIGVARDLGIPPSKWVYVERKMHSFFFTSL